MSFRCSLFTGFTAILDNNEPHLKWLSLSKEDFITFPAGRWVGIGTQDFIPFLYLHVAKLVPGIRLNSWHKSWWCTSYSWHRIRLVGAFLLFDSRTSTSQRSFLVHSFVGLPLHFHLRVGRSASVLPPLPPHRSFLGLLGSALGNCSEPTGE